MASKLKPCPWCRTAEHLKPAHPARPYVSCGKCHCYGPEPEHNMFTQVAVLIAAAHDEWNSYARHLTAWERDHTLDC